VNAISEIDIDGWSDGYFNYKVIDGGDWWTITKHLPLTFWTHIGSFSKNWNREQVEAWFEKEEVEA
jgi:hypothetical protein